MLVCLVCPIVEGFDTWDPPIDSGNDSEFSLVIAALSVGAVYLFVRSIPKPRQRRFADRQDFSLRLPALLVSTRRFDFCVTDAGPPPLSLRI